MIITRVEMTHLREMPCSVPLKPTWSFGATWGGLSRTVARIRTDKGYPRAPKGPGLGIEANKALDDEARIRAYATEG